VSKHVAGRGKVLVHLTIQLLFWCYQERKFFPDRFRRPLQKSANQHTYGIHYAGTITESGRKVRHKHKTCFSLQSSKFNHMYRNAINVIHKLLTFLAALISASAAISSFTRPNFMGSYVTHKHKGSIALLTRHVSCHDYGKGG
jgi:hypothetical protein